jgi:hypothetical protein
MANAETKRPPESPTYIADSVRERRKARTRRWFWGGLRDIGAGVLIKVGGAIVGLGAPLAGSIIGTIGVAVGIYGVAKSALGIGNGVLNTVTRV